MDDAQRLLRWSGYPAGQITVDGDDTPRGVWAEAAGPLLDLVEAPAADRIVCRSGSLAGEAFETWGPRGWEALEAACEQAAAWPCAVLLLPHADDVLSDVQRCLKLMESRGSDSLGLLLDPALLLTPSMVDRVEEHAARIAGVLVPSAGVRAVVLPNSSSGGVELPSALWSLIEDAAHAARVPLIGRSETPVSPPA